MIDIEKTKGEFLKYTEKYDLKNRNIKRKQEHSLRVMENSKKIAESLKLSEEYVKIAEIIGLLHDIARFEQYTKFKTFRDIDSVDHGDYGVEILNNDLRKYIDTNKYDDIIKIAVKNHNKYKIEDGLNEEELLFSKIIRDADKLDIFYEAEEIFWTDKQQEIENGEISEEIMEQFLMFHTVKRKKDDNQLAGVICIIGFIFDINYKQSLIIIKENDYINQILNRFNFKRQDTKYKIDKIRKISNNYIDTKINE